MPHSWFNEMSHSRWLPIYSSYQSNQQCIRITTIQYLVLPPHHTNVDVAPFLQTQRRTKWKKNDEEAPKEPPATRCYLCCCFPPPCWQIVDNKPFVFDHKLKIESDKLLSYWNFLIKNIFLELFKQFRIEKSINEFLFHRWRFSAIKCHNFKTLNILITKKNFIVNICYLLVP